MAYCVGAIQSAAHIPAANGSQKAAVPSQATENVTTLAIILKIIYLEILI